jgi:hypothetical protein
LLSIQNWWKSAVFRGFHHFCCCWRRSINSSCFPEFSPLLLLKSSMLQGNWFQKTDLKQMTVCRNLIF